MEPITLTTDRLLLRPFGPQDTDAVHAACQDPDIQRWTTVPSPYEREHAEEFVAQMVPDGWRDGHDVQLRRLPTPVSWSARMGWCGWLSCAAPGHRRRSATGPRRSTAATGYTTEAVRARGRTGPSRRWASTRLEWRAEVGNDALPGGRGEGRAS